jgi:hypothetical protein
MHLAAQAAGAGDSGPGTAADVAGLRAEIDRLKGVVPDQSHVMTDVGYHFANLWFAGQNRNWPLAKFCFDETRSHLNWAVRIIPVRKTRAGQDVDLRAILEAVDTSLLSQIGKAIQAEDRDAFTTAYQQSLEGCYSCHKAAEKPYLRPRIPESPAAPILDFRPGATSHE